jgi:preprotein translocase subunit YajC
LLVSGWESILPFVLIIAVFWFLVARPARNQQKKMAATQANIAVGSEVMLGSGIYGTVISLGDDTLQLEVSPGTRMKVARQAVVRVVEPATQPPGDPTDAQD